MTALEMLRMAFELGVVVSLWLIAARLRGLGRDVEAPPDEPAPPATDTTHERKRTMSLSANERRRHGLAFVRRKIATGKYSKADVASWEKEFGPEAVQDLLPDSEPAGSSTSSSKSKE